MKVVVLGGAGRFGGTTSWLLAQSEKISELVIVGRDLERAKAFADVLGAKARAAAADVADPASLDALLAGAALVANTTGPYYATLLPVLEAAIRNGVNYCDFSDEWNATEQALAQDVAARRAGITAIVGMGAAPGVTNLLGVRAAHLLDRVDSLDVGWYADIEHFGSVAEHLQDIRAGRPRAVMQTILQAFASPIYGIREGRQTRIDERDTGQMVFLADGANVMGLPFRSAEPLTLHRALPAIPNITSRVGILPQSSHGLLRSQAARIARHEVDAKTAAISFYEALAAEPERWLAGHRDMAFGGAFAMARGTKNAQRVRVAVAPAWTLAVSAPGVESSVTGAALALAALKILIGEVSSRGVLTPEAAFQPEPFLGDLARRWGNWDGRAPLFLERVEDI